MNRIDSNEKSNSNDDDDDDDQWSTTAITASNQRVLQKKNRIDRFNSISRNIPGNFSVAVTKRFLFLNIFQQKKKRSKISFFSSCFGLILILKKIEGILQTRVCWCDLFLVYAKLLPENKPANKQKSFLYFC